MFSARPATLAFVAFVLVGPLAARPAEARCEPVGDELAGSYAMRGVREVGSELILRADGRFRYMLAYGAVDEFAQGCWTRRRGVLTLTPSVMQASKGGRRFRRLDLLIDDAGHLLRSFDPSHVGRYVRS